VKKNGHRVILIVVGRVGRRGPVAILGFVLLALAALLVLMGSR
jgi:hypothetical protein